MWNRVIAELRNRGVRMWEKKKSNHVAAVVNHRGQILATGYNTHHLHAEASAIKQYFGLKLGTVQGYWEKRAYLQ